MAMAYILGAAKKKKEENKIKIEIKYKIFENCKKQKNVLLMIWG